MISYAIFHTVIQGEQKYETQMTASVLYVQMYGHSCRSSHMGLLLDTSHTVRNATSKEYHVEGMYAMHI